MGIEKRDDRWEVKIYDIRDVEIIQETNTRERTLLNNLEEIYSHDVSLGDYGAFTSDVGLDVEIQITEVIDREKIIKYFLRMLFESENWEIIDKEPRRDRVDRGHPDYIIKNEEMRDDKVYVEVKWREDSLRKYQIEWIYDRAKTDRVYVMYITPPDNVSI